MSGLVRLSQIRFQIIYARASTLGTSTTQCLCENKAMDPEDMPAITARMREYAVADDKARHNTALRSPGVLFSFVTLCRFPLHVVCA